MTQTRDETGTLTQSVARFVALGLFLMAFFTILWASWSIYGLPLMIAGTLLVIFATFAAVFVINSVQLIKSASRLPVPSGEEAKRRGRALQIGFGVTFATDGVIIALVCALLAISGAYDYFARQSRWSSA
jgi:hypothetical protein